MDNIEPSRMTSSDHLAAALCPPNGNSGGLPDSSAMMPSSAEMIYGMHLSFKPVAPCMSKPMELPNPSYHGDASLGMGPGAGFSVSEPAKKKRGRPRKYGLDGNTALALSPPTSVTNGYSRNPSSDPPQPKRRGRPPGSGKKQRLDAIGGELGGCYCLLNWAHIIGFKNCAKAELGREAEVDIQ